ncbi:MAG TPA: hypothetical protein PLI96_07955 [Halothiobacillus sp.]|nr:hypothetical protein [Halothiobacillus sp.]
MNEPFNRIELHSPKGLGRVDKVALSIFVVLAVPGFLIALLSSKPEVSGFCFTAPFVVALLFWVPAKLIAFIRAL